MLMDELKDVDKLKKEDMDTLDNEEKDTLGVKYLKVVNSVSVWDIAIYTVELPVSEHGRPKVNEAKMSPVNNLLDYDVFEEVEDKGSGNYQKQMGCNS